MENILKVVVPLIAVFSLAFNILQYFWSQARLRCRIGLGHGSQIEPPSTWIGASISISNIGAKSTYISYIKAVRSNGDYFFPSFSILGGTEIKPNTSITGLIPAGHFVGQDIKDLIVSDGVWREHKIPRKILRKALVDVTAEKIRWEALGHSVNPPFVSRGKRSSVETH